MFFFSSAVLCLEDFLLSTDALRFMLDMLNPGSVFS